MSELGNSCTSTLFPHFFQFLGENQFQFEFMARKTTRHTVAKNEINGLSEYIFMAFSKLNNEANNEREKASTRKV